MNGSCLVCGHKPVRRWSCGRTYCPSCKAVTWGGLVKSGIREQLRELGRSDLVVRVR